MIVILFIIIPYDYYYLLEKYIYKKMRFAINYGFF